MELHALTLAGPFLRALGIVNIIFFSIKETATPYRILRKGELLLEETVNLGFLQGFKGRRNSDLSGSHLSLKHRLMI